jgi:hypothetical protein
LTCGGAVGAGRGSLRERLRDQLRVCSLYVYPVFDLICIIRATGLQHWTYSLIVFLRA